MIKTRGGGILTRTASSYQAARKAAHDLFEEGMTIDVAGNNIRLNKEDILEIQIKPD